MDWNKSIFSAFAGDQDWHYPESHWTGFAWERTYEGNTKYGFKFLYTLSGFIEKIDHDVAKAAGMFDKTGQDRLIDDWHEKAFIPTLEKIQRFAEIDFSPPNRRVRLCGTIKEGKEIYVAKDVGCEETQNAINAMQYYEYGCHVLLWMIVPTIEETLMVENYNMLKLRNVADPENDPVLLQQQEILAVVLWKRYFELQREFQNVQSTQHHDSEIIAITTKLAGRSVELSWKLRNYQNKEFVLRGYRSETGFTAGNSYKDHGQCIVETRQDGVSSQHLQEGKEYFYTFLLTTENPVYANDTLGDTVRVVIGSPKVKRIETTVVDSLSFMVRVPTQMEILSFA